MGQEAQGQMTRLRGLCGLKDMVGDVLDLDWYAVVDLGPDHYLVEFRQRWTGAVCRGVQVRDQLLEIGGFGNIFSGGLSACSSESGKNHEFALTIQAL